MAKTENQGLQIAVIIFAFLTIALSVATFYFFNDASTQYANHAAALTKQQELEKRERTLLDERNTAMSMISGDPQKKVADAQTLFKTDMTKTMDFFKPKDKAQNYTQAIDLMISTVEQLKARVAADEIKRLTDLEEFIKKVEADAKKKNDEVKAEFDKQVADFNQRTAAYKATDEKHLGEVKDLTDKLNKKQEELTKIVAEKTNEIQKIAAEREKALAMAADAKKQQYERENYVFERPDGMIVAVNPKENTVWIDVGRIDGLRPNLRFTVFKRGLTNVYVPPEAGETAETKPAVRRQKKGVIEVKRFLGESMAEAHILESELRDPIMEGDVIFTPTWTPREPERYVLAGEFDVNNDKKPDNELVQQLVRMGGGEIDAELTIKTRYLLLGESPSDKTASDAYNKLRQQAKQLNIKIMTLAEFLEYTGGRELMRRAVSLASPPTEELDTVMRGKDQLEQTKFRTRSADDGARRVDAGSAPRSSSSPKEPPRRTQPGAVKTGNGGARK
jgi:type II secretory pathway component PulJ